MKGCIRLEVVEAYWDSDNDVTTVEKNIVFINVEKILAIKPSTYDGYDAIKTMVLMVNGYSYLSEAEPSALAADITKYMNTEYQAPRILIFHAYPSY